MLQLYDLAGIYFRAFYAVPGSLVGPHGRPVNAIRGSLDILAKVIADARPTRGVACLDVDWRPAWRVELVPSYKAHRVAVTDSGVPASGDPIGAELGTAVGAEPGPLAEAVPDDLSPQVPVLLDVLRAIGITLAGAEGCEADDVIGTLAARESREPVEVVSGDRDLFQLVRAEPVPVTVRYIGAGMNRAEVIDDDALRSRYGVDGAGYAAMATLRGDPSDGLPGVAGIGEKTAADLIGRFGSLEALLAAAEDPGAGLSAGVRRKLAAATDYLPAAWRVVRVSTDAELHVEPAGDAELPREPADPQGLEALVEEHGLGGSSDRLLAALADR
jgi:5'-3' exonuclease